MWFLKHICNTMYCHFFSFKKKSIFLLFISINTVIDLCVLMQHISELKFTLLFDRYRASSFGCKSDVDMFCREVAILSKLNSPYVISFVGASLDDPSVSAKVYRWITKFYLFLIID